MAPTTTPPSNPWFGVSMALVGVIVGYGVAVVSGGNMMAAPQQVAQAPTPAPAAAPTPAPAPAAEPAGENLPPPNEEDHIRGNANAPISIIEYSDYECPFCQRHHPTLQQAMDEFGSEVNWIYRHYPLSFHPNAEPSAIAAECVGELGGSEKFWEFTDMVIEQGAVATKLADYATSIGIDGTAFQTCVDSGKYAEKVANQMAEGTTAGVRGTPGTFIYNNETGEAKYISGAQPYANVKAAIESLQ